MMKIIPKVNIKNLGRTELPMGSAMAKWITWTKEDNKTVMRCFSQCDPTKCKYWKQMMKIWREKGVFQVTEQRVADQTRMTRTTGWLPEVELDQIQRKIKQEENTEKPRSELQNTCDHRMITGSQDEDNIEATNA